MAEIKPVNLQLIYGSMFCGKSTELIRRLTVSADTGYSCLHINYTGDERLTESGDDHISSHNSSYKGMSLKIDKIKTLDITTIDVSDYDVVGIDEGQFFKGLATTVIYWTTILHKTVIISSLDGDYNRNSFGEVHQLIGLATKIKKLYAICMKCPINSRRKGVYTLKLPGGNKEQEDIGGADKYISVCPTCYDLYNTFK